MVDMVPAVEADHQRVLFEHAIHLIAGRLQPLVSFVARKGSSGTAAKADQIGWVCKDQIDGLVRKPDITSTQLPRTYRDMLFLLSQMQRQLRRADTTAGRKAENAGAVPQAAAQ